MRESEREREKEREGGRERVRGREGGKEGGREGKREGGRGREREKLFIACVLYGMQHHNTPSVHHATPKLPSNPV